MRLRPSEGPLSVRNDNNDILNSPKRINTLQNSNVTADYSSTNHTVNTADLTLETLFDNTGNADNLNTLNNINDGQIVRWCDTLAQEARNRQLSNNLHNQLLNINNLAAVNATKRQTAPSIFAAVESPDDSLVEDEDKNYSSSPDTSPQEENQPFDISDSDSSEETNLNNRNKLKLHRRGIINPNYPGFQHLAHTLDLPSPLEDFTDDDLDDLDDPNNINNNNNTQTIDKIDSVNRLDSIENIQKVFHDKQPFKIDELDVETTTKENPHIEHALESELEEVVEKLQKLSDFGPSAAKYVLEPNTEEPFCKVTPIKTPTFQDIQTIHAQESPKEKMSPERSFPDAFLSNAEEPLVDANLNVKQHSSNAETSSNRELLDIERQIKKIKSNTNRVYEEVERFCMENVTKCCEEEKGEESAVPRKKEKMELYGKKKKKEFNQGFGSLVGFSRRELPKRDPMNRRSVPMAREKRRMAGESFGGFDVYNIETAMPKIDLEAIENHLRAAKEEERRRRTDREEIRRRLAMGSEDDYYSDRPGRKPSLQARLQSGMNLQICFMNETASDNESPSSDSECAMTNAKQSKNNMKQETVLQPPTRPATLSLGQPHLQPHKEPLSETDFFTRQARLQTEARMALAQAKEMARMQMEIERQRQKKSPITEMVRHSLEKVGIPFPEEKRRLSRQILTDMNVAQLQVIVNDLHTQIETLNEHLVKFLMERDDLHMEQDSMLVDIEDLTRYLGAKEQVLKEQNLAPTPQNNNLPPPSPAPSSPLAALNSTVKPHLHRIASLVKK